MFAIYDYNRHEFNVATVDAIDVEDIHGGVYIPMTVLKSGDKYFKVLKLYGFEADIIDVESIPYLRLGVSIFETVAEAEKVVKELRKRRDDYFARKEREKNQSKKTAKEGERYRRALD